MKTGILAAAGLTAALLLAGCGNKDGIEGKTGADITAKSSADDIGEAYLNELTRLADALESVEDEASAKAAAKKIKKSVDGLNNMKEELEGKLNGPQAMQIFGGRYSEFVDVQTRLGTAMVQLQLEHPDLAEIVNSEMDRLEN